MSHIHGLACYGEHWTEADSISDQRARQAERQAAHEREHVHEWREVSVGCEDCGDHTGLTCDGSVPCPAIEAQVDNGRGYVESWSEGDNAILDLVFADDPREA